MGYLLILNFIITFILGFCSGCVAILTYFLIKESKLCKDYHDKYIKKLSERASNPKAHYIGNK